MKSFLLIVPLLIAHLGLATEPPNVLFIAIDDLRDLSGIPGAKMPNLDRLSKMGMTFERAYCSAPVCNASRASVLSGLRPSTTGVYENDTDGRTVIPPEYALPATFRKAGYYVCGAGKIDHQKFDQRELWDAWQKNDGHDPAPTEKISAGNFLRSPLDCEDRDMEDFKITQYGIDFLLNDKARRPFFLAIGLHKPHSPWNVPRKYYDLFPLSSITIPPGHFPRDTNDLPPSGQRMALFSGPILPKPRGDHDKIIRTDAWKEAIQGYLAASAFADAQLGRLLDAYEKSPFHKNTILCLWSDHGWHLGEKDHWRKYSLWEQATRSPFYWIVPGLTKPGSVCTKPVDLMCIYPTLTALCSIPTPKHVEGENIRPLLADPDTTWNKPAITTYMPNNHAIRVAGWRYIQYADGGVELYDEKVDPYEWNNLANNGEYRHVKEELAALLPTVNLPDHGVKSQEKEGKGKPASGNSPKQSNDSSDD